MRYIVVSEHNNASPLIPQLFSLQLLSFSWPLSLYLRPSFTQSPWQIQFDQPGPLISDTFQIFNPPQHCYGDMPNIAHISGHRFNSYLATARERVCRANMAAAEMWRGQDAHVLEFIRWLIRIDIDGGMAAKEDGSTRRESESLVLVGRQPMLTLWESTYLSKHI